MSNKLGHWNKIKHQITTWRFDFLAGLSVALIALPLSLGLATASGAPPSSGIISSIVGGIIVAIIGGAYVTITGPGNGLIVILLTAILSLGGGDMLLGFEYTLAAVIVSGILMVIMGYIRLGILADLFPSSAIQGLLAGIGVIIIAQQFHVMFGINFEKKEFSNYDLITAIPNTLYNYFSFNFHDASSLIKMNIEELSIIAKEIHISEPESMDRDSLIKKIISYQTDPYVGLIGILSLIIMFVHAKIHIKLVHILPAPMWVIIIAAGVLVVGRNYIDLNFISSEYTILLPSDLKNSLISPNFDKVFTKDSIIAILSIAVIGTLESLLSMKAVDKLDHFKRKSNANKDLKALGWGSVLSGFAGGLPVVTVIGRSSVNVNNGAKTRASNFFPGVILLLIILIFSPLLKNITYSALAGILVYTGYKLCEPIKFIKTYKIGLEQLVIFTLTFLGTIVTNLLLGIMIGVVTTIIFQIIKSPFRSYFLREMYLPNTILFEESKGRYYLSVKWVSNFLNFFILKKKLDSVPRKSHITLDFSMAKLVDTTVMEQIFFYKEDYSKNGTFEVIGLEIHQPSSNHPFAVRHISHDEDEMTPTAKLSKHQKHIKQYMLALKWEFRPEYVYDIQGLKNFPYFNYKNIDYANNICRGEKEGISFTLFDLEYHEGEFIAKEDFKSTMVKIELNFEIPSFVIDKESALERITKIGGGISFDNHKDFSNRFKLKGRNPNAIKAFFNDELILFFESNPYYHIESNGKAILIAKKERLASLGEIKAMVDFSNRLIKNIHHSWS